MKNKMKNSVAVSLGKPTDTATDTVSNLAKPLPFMGLEVFIVLILLFSVEVSLKTS